MSTISLARSQSLPNIHLCEFNLRNATRPRTRVLLTIFRLDWLIAFIYSRFIKIFFQYLKRGSDVHQDTRTRKKSLVKQAFSRLYAKLTFKSKQKIPIPAIETASSATESTRTLVRNRRQYDSDTSRVDTSILCIPKHRNIHSSRHEQSSLSSSRRYASLLIPTVRSLSSSFSFNSFRFRSVSANGKKHNTAVSYSRRHSLLKNGVLKGTTKKDFRDSAIKIYSAMPLY
ncbi:uncharacterized protein V2V93DRAFT_374196 [Kockiozyma suomiensis]|uniref:uncharacterized protein n=1 Tax=Kockiozyma suomiensis TaxID=1337062 RepID=UPI0033443199